jgi:hypothetical protein
MNFLPNSFVFVDSPFTQLLGIWSTQAAYLNPFAFFWECSSVVEYLLSMCKVLFDPQHCQKKPYTDKK